MMMPAGSPEILEHVLFQELQDPRMDRYQLIAHTSDPDSSFFVIFILFGRRRWSGGGWPPTILFERQAVSHDQDVLAVGPVSLRI